MASPSYFKSTFLQSVENEIIKHVSSDKPFIITTSDGQAHTLTEEEMEELRSFFKVGSSAIAISNASQMVSYQKKQDEKFRREIEKMLFKSIYPNSWQMGTLIRELDMLINWKDKRQRALITIYEPYINRALNSLRERKKKWDEKIGWPSKDPTT